MFAEDNIDNRKALGAFAKVKIPKGTIIFEFKGDVINSEDIPKDLKPEDDYYLQIAPNKYLGPSGWLDDKVNHSCNFNCYVQIVGHRAFLISLYEILPGHQITFDYSTTSTETPEEWSMKCNCGSYTCRKTISGYNSLDQTTRENYEKLGIVPKYVMESVK